MRESCMTSLVDNLVGKLVKKYNYIFLLLLVSANVLVHMDVCLKNIIFYCYFCQVIMC